MAETESTAPAPPDLTKGVSARDIPEGGMILGRVGSEDVVLARIGHHFFAVGAYCTHYHAPLVKGLVVDDTVRCPLHHSCFSLRTGEAVRAPAFDPLTCWQVAREHDVVLVREKIEPQRPPGAAAR